MAHGIVDDFMIKLHPPMHHPMLAMIDILINRTCPCFVDFLKNEQKKGFSQNAAKLSESPKMVSLYCAV